MTDACISVWGADCVGMHLVPRADAHKATFGYIARELGKRRIAFICSREALGPGQVDSHLKQAFGCAYTANEQLTKDSAQQLLATGEADAVAFGKLFIANSGLPRRFLLDAQLNTPAPNTFNRPSAEGSDYPALAP